MPHILMCPPDFYGIEYEINPWMSRARQANHELAIEQWQGLYDQLVAAGATIFVVGHKNRYTDHFARMQRHLSVGFLGEVLEMRVQGKQDQRSGGEDLIVLGTHDFDAMRFFFGDPISCYATVTAQGKRITKADVRKGREPILVAGDTANDSAMFLLPGSEAAVRLAMTRLILPELGHIVKELTK